MARLIHVAHRFFLFPRLVLLTTIDQFKIIHVHHRTTVFIGFYSHRGIGTSVVLVGDTIAVCIYCTATGGTGNYNKGKKGEKETSYHRFRACIKV